MPPNAFTPLNTEDEIRALIRNPDIELEENPSDDEEPMEEDPSEEEPSEEERNEAPPSPTNSPNQPQSPRTNTEYPNDPLLTYPPESDPYFLPSPTNSPPLNRWSWIRSVLNIWRRDDSSRVPDTTESSTTALISPFTGETTHYTIPLLIARLFRHEDQIEELQNARRATPSPVHTHRELHYLRNAYLDLSSRHERTEEITTRELNHFAHRLDVYEEDFMNLRNQIEDLNSRVRDLEIRRH